MPRSSTSTGSGSTAALAWAILVHLLKGRKKPGPCSGAPLLSTLSAVPTSGRERRKSSGAVRLIAREARSMLKLATTVSSTCTGVTTGWVPPMVTKRDRRRAASAWSMVVERLIMHRRLTPSVPRLGRSSSASDSGPESGGCSEPEEGAELGGFTVHRLCHHGCHWQGASRAGLEGGASTAAAMAGVAASVVAAGCQAT
jgi:hypothetical protein